MSDRRRLLMQLREEASILPEGYYPCEYIESDGQQYIDTQVYWHTSGRLVMDVEPMGAGTLFGTSYYGSGEDYEERYMLDISLNGYIVCESIDSNKTWNYNQIGVRSVIDWNKRDVYLNGKKIISLSQSYNIELPPAGLFGHLAYSDEQWAESMWYISAKLYSCQMYNSSGELLRDYVPCFSAAYGRFGLYDRVSKTFFGSTTTVGFKGKLAVPSGYSAVEYIYGDGNAYIDTGYKHNQTTRVIMDVEPVGTPTENKFLFEGYQADGYRKGIYWNYSNSCWSVDYASSSARKNISTTYAQKLHIDYDRNSCKFNNTTISFTAKTFQSTQNEYILAVNNNGTTTRITPARLYFYCIYDNGTLVRLFAPCVNSNNIYGLYDLVNKKFYQSAGSSHFGEEPVVYDFDYTGGEQSVLLKAGNYKLETWGAEGGKGAPSNVAASAGKGGYSVGVYSVTEPTTVYINVGGKGQSGADSLYNTNITKGGYNGGGNGGGSVNTYCYPGGAGGGATHIATKAGLLVGLLSSTSNILIVAGGGGGEGGPSYSRDTEEELYFLNQDSQGSGGIGGGIGGGAGIEGHSGMIRDGQGGAAGSNNWAGSGGSGGTANENERERTYYVSGGGGGGGGGYYAGGGGGSGAVSGPWPIDGNAGGKGGFGIGGAGGAYVGEDGYYTGPGGGGGGGSGYLAPLLTSASSTAGQRSGHGYARITKI